MKFAIRPSFPPLSDHEDGFTLVEMLIGIVLLSLTLLAVSGLMSAWGKGYANSSIAIGQDMAGDILFQTLRQDFHTAVAIEQTGNELAFRNSNRERVRYHLSSNQNLIRSVDGRGASVLAGSVVSWTTSPVGTKGVEVNVILNSKEHAGKGTQGQQWTGREVITMRGDDVSEQAQSAEPAAESGE